MKQKATAVVIIGILLAKLAESGGLKVGFYRGKCGIIDVETVVAAVVTANFIRDPSIVAALLRLQFHDCFTNVSTSLLLYSLEPKLLVFFINFLKNVCSSSMLKIGPCATFCSISRAVEFSILIFLAAFLSL